jgi:DNA mismatch repair ATPase MutS
MSYIEVDVDQDNESFKRQKLNTADLSGQERFRDKIIFLYKVVDGASQSSYGLNVARLVGLDDSTLLLARKKSDMMKHLMA